VRFPEPEPGLVFRYDFTWFDDAKKGHGSGKVRPACVAVAAEVQKGLRRVVVLPITHSKPSRGTKGIEIPAIVRAALGLDDMPCWVIVSEYNIDDWPNAGIGPVPGRAGEFLYGHLPPGLFARIKQAFLDTYDPNHAVRR
jgi:hypothetical protein